jgi:hypothetical protein
MYSPGVAEERQLQFEADAAAFNTLQPRQQRRATSIAKFGYDFREGVAVVGGAVMGGADWLFNTLVTIPFNAIKLPVAKAFEGLAKRLNINLQKNPDSKINRLWKNLREKFDNGMKKAGAFIEYHIALRLYRATGWILSPRRRSGKPLLGNGKFAKVVTAGLALGTFAGLWVWLAGIEVMAKVWHAQIAVNVLDKTAPRLVRLGRQFVLHPALSVFLAGTQFLVVPPIAAARQALKSIRLMRGISYQFNALMQARSARQDSKPATGWRPSASVKTFFNEIAEKTSPEFYMARIKHYQAEKKAKLAPPLNPA